MEMTYLPALTYQLNNKGLIREGFDADLVRFDPENVEDKATFDHPNQPPVGIPYVLIVGRPVVTGNLTFCLE
jgi:N-acyl-D-amino-acid deacylase